jgi:hypothetical protein
MAALMTWLPEGRAARAVLASASAVATLVVLTASAAAAEPWPPLTAPHVDLEPGELPAPPAPPAPEIAPAPPPPASAPPPAAAPPPPVFPPPPAPPPPAAEPGVGADLVRRAPPPEAPRALGARGSVDGQLYLRTLGDGLVLLPTLRLETDARSVATDQPYASGRTLALGRAVLDVTGWAGGTLAVALSADLAARASWWKADNFVALAPWGRRLIVQVGRFDAPFSLENRTPERYLDLVDRGAAVRAFAIPANKDQGLMVHGVDPDGHVYYAAAVLSGKGVDVAAVDAHVDVMGRAWVAPFSFGDPDSLRAITLGGSVWTGDRATGGALAPQTTQAGFTVLDANVWDAKGAMTPFELRERGRLRATALEVDAPIAHRFGARFEWLAKRQPLEALDVANSARPTSVGALALSGWAMYGELWAWALGDDRLLGAPAAAGLGLPVRLSDFVAGSPRPGLRLAARVDYVDEQLSRSGTNGPEVGVASLGETKLTALTLGASGWYSRRAHLAIDYVFNRVAGDTPYVVGLSGRTEHEVLMRLSLAL